MLNQQWILVQDSTIVQSTSIFSCLPWGLIRWMMPRHKLLGPVMQTLGVGLIHNMPPSVHYMPKVCIIRHKKMCPGSCSMKMCPLITRHVLVEHSGSRGKEEPHGTLRTHFCFNVHHVRVPFQGHRISHRCCFPTYLFVSLQHFVPLYPMVRDRDHRNVEGLQTHPKAVRWKFRNHLCVSLGCQV